MSWAAIGKPWEYIGSHGHPFEVFGHHGKPWGAMGDGAHASHGKPCKTWEVLGRHLGMGGGLGKSRDSMGDHVATYREVFLQKY